MKVYTGLMARSLSEVPAAARKVEELGYDGVSVGETAHDPFLPLLLAAEHTEKIKVGPSVAIAFPRSPMVMANASWDIQEFSKGRFELGLGTQVKGHNLRRFSVPWSPPLPRLREYVQALRAIWDCWQNGTKLDFVGQHYSFTLMTPFFNPGPIQHPQIPVYTAAVTPTMSRMAGEVADGLLMHGLNTAKFTREVLLPAIKAGAQKAGRSLDNFEISGGGFLITGKTEEDIERQKPGVRQHIAFYASTRTYKVVLDTHGWSDTAMQLHELSLKGQVGAGRADVWQEMGKLISDEMMEHFCVMATYDNIVKKLKERYRGIATRIGFSIPTPNRDEEERLKEMVRLLKAD